MEDVTDSFEDYKYDRLRRVSFSYVVGFLKLTPSEDFETFSSDSSISFHLVNSNLD
jgi:hypothetical protein